MKKARLAFTMIELIFVIVILGILAAIAVPKMYAVRDDAKVAAEVSNTAQALQNLASEYTAKGTFVNYTINDANNVLHCFSFTLNNAGDGNVTLSALTAGTANCSASVLTTVIARARENGLLDNTGLSKDYVFIGTGVQ